MGSREPDYWCEACNLPIRLNGANPCCPYCKGPPMKPFPRCVDAHDVDLLPPSLAPHADFAMRAYHSIFGPIPPKDYYRSNHPVYRPSDMPTPRSNHPFHDRIPIGAPPMYRSSIASTSRSNHPIHEQIPIGALPMYRPSITSASRSNHPIHEEIPIGALPMHRPSITSASRSNHPIHEEIPNRAPYYQRNADVPIMDEPIIGETEVSQFEGQLEEDEPIVWEMGVSQFEGHYSPPPASKSAVRRLPTIEVSEQHLNDEGKCPVCLEKFELNSKAKQMPCHHIFHPDCIVSWLERHNTCPVCRFELPASRATTSRLGRRLRSMNPLSCIFPRLRPFRR